MQSAGKITIEELSLIDKDEMAEFRSKMLSTAAGQKDGKVSVTIVSPAKPILFGLFNYVSKKTKIWTIDQVLGMKVDVNKIYHEDNNFTPLIYAVKSGSARNVELLLKKGADVNAIDSLRDTALIYAVKSKNTDIVRVILEEGSGVNVNYCRRDARAIHSDALEIAQQSMYVTEIEVMLLASNATLRNQNTSKEDVQTFAEIVPVNTVKATIVKEKPFESSALTNQKNNQEKAPLPQAKLVEVEKLAPTNQKNHQR